MQSRSLPGFIIATMLLIQGVGSSTFVIIPCLVSSANLFFKGSFIATGTRPGTCCTGVCVLSILMWYSLPKHLKPLNTSSYCSMSLLLVHYIQYALLLGLIPYMLYLTKVASVVHR